MPQGLPLPRRSFLTGLSTSALFPHLPLLAATGPAASAAGFNPLDGFIRQYMQAMNAPGLTLALANRNGQVRTAGFGYSNLETRTPVTPNLLFEIGSITKSFVAITLLQLHDEGKLDLQKPVLDYLPWLPFEDTYGPVTTHHLLTHSSGLPGSASLFPGGGTRIIQMFEPGKHFSYCNMGFVALGFLIQALDRRPWTEAVRARILAPLGMETTTHVSINDRNKAQRSNSYTPFFTDRVYPRQGRLAPAPEIVTSSSAGSIVSTPGGMALYLQMLLNRGQASTRRILSEESFTLFATPHIKADEFGPTASYGYGIAVDQLDGHKILRHTGGMVSFASSITVDLDAGAAAFASINAMQGYRPVPVTQYAVQFMNALSGHTAAPQPPTLDDPADVANASNYAAHYTTAGGHQVEVLAQGARLVLKTSAASIPLQRVSDDSFLTGHPDWPLTITFGRQGPTGPVVELLHGASWYTNSRYTGPQSFPEPEGYRALTGYYQSESAWTGGTQVVLRKGRLWLDGERVLSPLGANLFRLGDDPNEPETAEFFHVVDGQAQLLKLDGERFLRVHED